MPVTKAIIPAAGRGTRLSPLSRFYPKELLPLGGKPVIQRVVEEAADAGITHVVIVTRDEKPALQEYFSGESLPGSPRNVFETYLRDLLNRVRFSFAMQREPLGLGDAISSAGGIVDSEPFAMLLPDNIFASSRPVIGELLDVYEQHQGTVIATKILINSQGARIPGNEAPMAHEVVGERVVRLTEIGDKGAPPFPASATPLGDLRGIGRGVFTPGFLEAVEAYRETYTHELDDVGALQILLRSEAVFGRVIEHAHYDVGDFPGFIRAQRHFVPVDTENQFYHEE